MIKLLLDVRLERGGVRSFMSYLEFKITIYCSKLERLSKLRADIFTNNCRLLNFITPKNYYYLEVLKDWYLDDCGTNMGIVAW